MESKELTVREKEVLQLRERSIGLIATLSDSGKARDFEKALTLQKIVNEAQPICEVIKNTSSREVAMALDIALTKLVAMVNVNQNLNDGQIKIIVEDLLDKYPNESLEDFILCFKKARHGEFGIIYHVHSAIVFAWMDLYLDQKYQVIERNLMLEKENFHKPIKPEPSNIDWHKKWLDEVRAVESKPKSLEMTDEEIKREGQEKPVSRYQYPTTSATELQKRELHFRYITENYDARTADKLPNWESEESWLKINNI